MALRRTNGIGKHLESQPMKRCIKIGAVAGFASGIIVFIGYVITSWWVCSTLLGCPGHWLPYLAIFGVGVSVFTLMGVTAAAVLHKLYDYFRVEG